MILQFGQGLVGMACLCSIWAGVTQLDLEDLQASFTCLVPHLGWLDQRGVDTASLFSFSVSYYPGLLSIQMVSIYLSIYLSIYPSIHLSSILYHHYLSIHPSIHSSIHPSIHQCTHSSM